MSSVRRENSLIKLPGIVLMAVCLSFCFIESAVAEEQSAPSAKVVPCKDLKPFNNIDELLYQFWVNLESDCLFEMPVEQLEEIWGIKILSKERAPKPEEYARLRNSADFENKPYMSEKDAFFVEIARGTYTNEKIFYIVINTYYYKKHATLFPAGNYPALIPKPLQELNFKLPHYIGQNKPLRPQHRGVYSLDDYDYYWLSSDRTRKISLEGIYGVFEVVFLHKLNPNSVAH